MSRFGATIDASAVRARVAFAGCRFSGPQVQRGWSRGACMANVMQGAARRGAQACGPQKPDCVKQTEDHAWCTVQETASKDGDGAVGEQVPQARIIAYSDSDSDDELPKLPFRRQRKEEGGETADDEPITAAGTEEKTGLLPWRGWNKPDKAPQVGCPHIFHFLPWKASLRAHQIPRVRCAAAASWLLL